MPKSILLVSLFFVKYQELDNDLRSHRNELKEFERQNLKDREDFDHLKKKIKKLGDKFERV